MRSRRGPRRQSGDPRMRRRSGVRAARRAAAEVSSPRILLAFAPCFFSNFSSTPTPRLARRIRLLTRLPAYTPGYSAPSLPAARVSLRTSMSVSSSCAAQRVSQQRTCCSKALCSPIPRTQTTTLGTHALRRATRRAASCSERTELLPLLLLRPAACCSAPTSRAPRRSLRTSAPRALTVSPKTPGGSNGTSQESFPPPSFPAAFGENQLVPLPASVVSRLASLHSSFRAPLRFAFAYGSGVFAQHAGPEHSRRPEGPKGKMVDIVMAVAHPEHWHAVNMQQHPGHYSRVARLLGSGMMARVQRLGAGIWYNPYVKVGDEVSARPGNLAAQRADGKREAEMQRRTCWCGGPRV